jgi:hypothetical protein
MDAQSGSTSSWDYLDFDLEIREGEPRGYAVAVRSPAGEAQEEMSFPFDERQLRDKLKDLEIALLRSGGTRRRLSSEEQTVQDFGRRLFEALLVGDVRTRYLMSLDKAEQQDKGLRMKLRVQPPELAVLPWEFLYDPDRDYLCFSPDTPIVRYVDLRQPVRRLTVEPPLRILGMVASPRGLDPLDVEHEKDLMNEAIEELRDDGLVELTWLEGQTWRDLRRAIRRDGPWHVFHFVGHGDFDVAREEGAIALTDGETGREHLLRSRDLARLLDGHRHLRLVFLNSCEGARGSEGDPFSGTAATLVHNRIPAVVAMQYEITDKAAIEFSRSFYEALADGWPVDAAVTDARVAVSMDSMLEWGTPVLYMRSPDGRIFDLSTQAPRGHPTPETEDRQEEDPMRRYREGVESAWTGGELDRRQAERLRDLAHELGLNRSAAADLEREVMDDTIDAILEPEEHNADVEALQRLEGSDHNFSQAELEELRPLLGLYGSEVEKRLPLGKAETKYVIERMLHWKQKIDQSSARSVERTVAERAYTRYGIIYEELAAQPRRRKLSDRTKGRTVSDVAPYFGIDFGTSNSSMAWCDPETGQAEVILNEEGDEKTPSIVYFGENEIIVGKYARELLEEAEDSTDPEERDDVSQRIVRSIKRNLLSPPIIPIPGREPVRPVEVVAHILGKLKRDAEEAHFHEEVERVVVTCPATFDTQQQQVLLDGAAMSGFRRVELLEDPAAAALTLTTQEQEVGRGVLIYDLGAGTFDLSVVARDSEDSPFYLLMEPQGDPQFGGDDLDLALYNYCDSIAFKELGRHISLTEGVIDLAFLRQCRSRKEDLSVSWSTRFTSYLSSNNGLARFRYEINRETFESLIRPRIEDTVKMTAKLWDQVKDQVEAVVLIGGSSRIPLVRQRLEDALKVELRSFGGKNYAIALGAAYKAHALWIKEPASADEPPGINEYRRGLKSCWNERWLSRHELDWLANLAKQELELSPEVAARVEGQVMGDTIQGILERQEPVARNHYARVLELGWKDRELDALRRIPPATLNMLLDDQDRFCGFDFADSPVSAAERKEMAEGLPWSVFVMAARVITAPDLSTAGIVAGLDAIADELGLSKDQAAKVERETLGKTQNTWRS